MGSTQSNAANTQDRNRHTKFFYLVFGEPRIRYVGQGRGPLLFHVHTPDNCEAGAVDEAETTQCPVTIPPRTLVIEAAESTGLILKFSIQSEVDGTMDVFVRGESHFNNGFSVTGTSVLHDHVFTASPQDVSVAIDTNPAELVQHRDGALSFAADSGAAAARAAAAGVPSRFGICLVLRFSIAAPVPPQSDPSTTELTIAVEPPDPILCTVFHFVRLTQDRGGLKPNVECVLLQHGQRLFKIDDLFDVGRDEAPAEAAEAASPGADEDDACVICFSNPKDTVALPCRHLCMCGECAQVLRNQSNKCPMCRTAIEKLIRKG